jgi:hypothetical protein
MLEDEGIHPILVDKWDDREADCERDRHHEYVRLKAC